MYDLETLIKTFEENAILAAKDNERLTEQWIQENPGEKVPEWFTRDFCINTALAAMCKEIDKLWMAIGGR
jgi:hypothetical protein